MCTQFILEISLGTKTEGKATYASGYSVKIMISIFNI